MALNEFVECAGELVSETSKAIKIVDGDYTVWLPKSQLKNIERVTIGGKQNIAFDCPEWLAIDKGLI